MMLGQGVHPPVGAAAGSAEASSIVPRRFRTLASILSCRDLARSKTWVSRCPGAALLVELLLIKPKRPAVTRN